MFLKNGLFQSQGFRQIYWSPLSGKSKSVKLFPLETKALLTVHTIFVVFFLNKAGRAGIYSEAPSHKRGEEVML